MTFPTHKIHRLSDFIVNEVSLVDRAANKRRFLQIKRDPDEDTMPNSTQKITQNSDGSFSTESAPTEAVEKDMSAVEEIFFTVGDAVDRLMRVASVALQSDSLKLGDGPNEKTVIAEIESVKSVLDGMKDKIAEVSKKLDDAENIVAKGDGIEDTRSSEPEDSEDNRTVGELENLVESIGKSGAKMSKSRQQRFAAALEDLASILQEVSGADVEKTASPVEPETSTAPAENPELVAKLAKAEADREELRKENAALRRTPAVSQALPVEKAEVSEDDNFSWPADMTKPLGRDDVPVEKRF